MRPRKEPGNAGRRRKRTDDDGADVPPKKKGDPRACYGGSKKSVREKQVEKGCDVRPNSSQRLDLFKLGPSSPLELSQIEAALQMFEDQGNKPTLEELKEFVEQIDSLNIDSGNTTNSSFSSSHAKIIAQIRKESQLVFQDDKLITSNEDAPIESEQETVSSNDNLPVRNQAQLIAQDDSLSPKRPKTAVVQFQPAHSAPTSRPKTAANYKSRHGEKNKKPKKAKLRYSSPRRRRKDIQEKIKTCYGRGPLDRKMVSKPLTPSRPKTQQSNRTLSKNVERKKCEITKQTSCEKNSFGDGDAMIQPSRPFTGSALQSKTKQQDGQEEEEAKVEAKTENEERQKSASFAQWLAEMKRIVKEESTKSFDRVVN